MRHNVKKPFRDGAARIIIALATAFVLCVPLAAARDKGDRAAKKARDPKATEQRVDGQTGAEAATDDKSAEKAGTAPENRENLPLKDYRDEDFKPKLEEDSYAWMLFKTLLVMGLLLGGFYYFFRFVTKKAGINALGGEAVQVLSVVPVGQNKFLQVVDLAGRILILGVTDSQINLITEVTDRDEIDRIRILSARRQVPQDENFQEFMTHQLGRIVTRVSEFVKRDRKQTGAGTVRGDDSLDHLKTQRDRLRGLNGYKDE